MAEEKAGSTGMQQNVAGLLCYALGWVTGLVFYFMEKENKFVRFHAMQSIIVFGGLSIIGGLLTLFAMLLLLIPTAGPILFGLLVAFGSLLVTVLWILLMVKAYQNVRFKIPKIGDLAEKYS